MLSKVGKKVFFIVILRGNHLALVLDKTQSSVSYPTPTSCATALLCTWSKMEHLQYGNNSKEVEKVASDFSRG